MKKTPRKLQLNREAVHQLGDAELTRAVGGGRAKQFEVDTEAATCPWTHVTPLNGG